jgi:hypothetical protein
MGAASRNRGKSLITTPLDGDILEPFRKSGLQLNIVLWIALDMVAIRVWGRWWSGCFVQIVEYWSTYSVRIVLDGGDGTLSEMRG